jgi:hypothetical protein
MTTLIKEDLPHLSRLVQTIKAAAVAAVGSNYHADKQSVGSDPLTIAAANGDGTLPTLLTLTKAIVATVLAHATDTTPLGPTGSTAHKAVDTTLSSTITVASVVDLASAETALNAVYTWYNTHIASTTYHYNADSTNAASSASATTQASADTRASDIKAKLNAHMVGGYVDLPVLRGV